MYLANFTWYTEDFYTCLDLEISSQQQLHRMCPEGFKVQTKVSSIVPQQNVHSGAIKAEARSINGTQDCTISIEGI